MADANNSRFLLQNNRLNKSQWNIDFLRIYIIDKFKESTAVSITTLIDQTS